MLFCLNMAFKQVFKELHSILILKSSEHVIGVCAKFCVLFYTCLLIASRKSLELFTGPVSPKFYVVLNYYFCFESGNVILFQLK